MALFILLLQFLSRYKDDIFGKGLKVSVLLEIFSYAMVSLVVLALPVSVLLSSLMTMGNFGQNYELAAMRSSGVSLPRILRPMFISTILISIFSFLLSNYVVTKANLKFHSLLYDVKQVKPSFTLQPGHFYSDIDNYVIRIADKDLRKEMLYDVMIYDHTARRGNDRIILADSGKMVVDEESLFMEMTLFHGVSHEMNKALQGNREVYQNARYYFDTLYYEFDLSGFGINRTPEELFATHQYMLNIGQLANAKDSINNLQRSLNNQYITQLQTITHVDSVFLDSNVIGRQPKRIVELFPKEKAQRIYQKARESCKFALTLTGDAKEKVAAEVRSFRDYDIEYHLKFSLPFSCLIFLLIGAPLGAIIRKGGIGMPIIVSVVFYLLFYVLMLQGKKMAQEGVVPVWLGVWLPVLILSPLAMFVTYESTAERKTLEHPAVYRTTQAIRNFFITINPLALLLRVSLVRRTIQASLRFFVSFRRAGRRVQTVGESPIMERLRKLREQGKPAKAATAEAEESPIERRLREIQARKEREAKLAGAEATTTPKTAATAQPKTSVSGSVHRQVYTEVYQPGWFTRLLALFGLADASPGLPGETPAERRLRLLREKQQKRGLEVPADILAKSQPLAKPETESEGPEGETPIERRLRELRERKAREAAEGGTVVESKTQDSGQESPEDETPIERRLRELRERKAREAAEGGTAVESTTPESAQEPPEDETPIARRLRELRERKAREAAEGGTAVESTPPESAQEPPEDETPIARRLRELRERKAREAAEAEKLSTPKPEKEVDLPSPGAEDETPIMRRLRRLRERKAREAEEKAVQNPAPSPSEDESASQTNEPMLDWGDVDSFRNNEQEEASEPAFEFHFGADISSPGGDESIGSDTGGLDFLFPDAEIATPELLLNFDFSGEEVDGNVPVAESPEMVETTEPLLPKVEPDPIREQEIETDEHSAVDAPMVEPGLTMDMPVEESANLRLEAPLSESNEEDEGVIETIEPILGEEAVEPLELVENEPDQEILIEQVEPVDGIEVVEQPAETLEEAIISPQSESVLVDADLDEKEPVVTADEEQVGEEPTFKALDIPENIAQPIVEEKKVDQPMWNQGKVVKKEPVAETNEVPVEKPNMEGPWIETISIGGNKNVSQSTQIEPEKEKKSWFGKVFGRMFGSKSGNLPAEAKVETPIERRLRELREKKDRESGNGDKGK